ncbi:MAG: recombination-associated protein RdgC [Azoarcus sp.]|jgi:recombination associated protein RdgC|nr:recombination-associated protein RdgC [Azoarcus sp.]
MWFKNLQIFRLPRPWLTSGVNLMARLHERQLQPCGSLDAEQKGWVAPADDPAELVRVVGDDYLIALGIETRLLPAAVVREEADRDAAALEQRQGFKPSRKQVKELREMAYIDMLPRAFTRRRRVFAWIDPINGWLCIDAASRNLADDVVLKLHDTLDEFPLSLVQTVKSPIAAMRDWVMLGEAPEGFTIDDDCEMQRTKVGVTAKVRHINALPSFEELSERVNEGFEPTRLALTWRDRVSFVLTDRYEVKKLDFLDVVRDEVDGDNNDEIFDSEFALMAGELKLMLAELVEALGGEKPQEA